MVMDGKGMATALATGSDRLGDAEEVGHSTDYVWESVAEIINKLIALVDSSRKT
jgi:hypothetical protein